MSNLRRMLLFVALVVAAIGCAPLSGQFLADYALGDFAGAPQPAPQDGQGVAVPFLHVDLSTESEYADHKDELKGLADLAVLGTLTNTGVTPLSLEVWITPGDTGPLDPAGIVTAGGVSLWGPMTLAAGATRQIGWDESAALFGAGRSMLLEQAKGDGEFTLYLVAGGSTFTLENAHLVLVLSAGI